MFDRAIIEMDKFTDLSMSSKALYFLLGMEADDEGFVSPKRVMNIYGGNDDDLKMLIVKNFVIAFESGVVVITDWNNNNWLDSRRIKPTKYVKEKEMVVMNKGRMYMLSNGLALAKPVESSIEESSTELRSENLLINKENMKHYSESEFSDTGEAQIDAETGEAAVEVKKTKATDKYWEMINWSTDRRGSPFLKQTIKKQFKAFSVAKDNKISPVDLKDRWIKMESDKFWIEKGFDWMDVVLSFNKKR